VSGTTFRGIRMNFKKVVLIASLFPLLCFAGVKDELEKECMASTQRGIPAMQRGYELAFKTNAEFQAARVEFCENGAKKWQAYSSKIIDAQNAETKLAQDQRIKDEQNRQLLQRKAEQDERDFDAAFRKNAEYLQNQLETVTASITVCMNANNLVFRNERSAKSKKGEKGAAELVFWFESAKQIEGEPPARERMEQCFQGAKLNGLTHRISPVGTVGNYVKLFYSAQTTQSAQAKAGSAAQQSFKPEWQSVLTELKDKTNIRSEPKSDASVVAQLQPGTKVEIETQQGSEWYKVRDLKTKSVLGYISEKRIIFVGH
jgi:hypothetical protein